MQRLLVGSALLILAGCTAPAEPPPNLDLASWVGAPIRSVIATWGEPTARIPAAPGYRYTWVATQYGDRTVPVNISPGGGPDDAADLAEFRCRAVFRTAADGTITAAAWRGEGCGMRN